MEIALIWDNYLIEKMRSHCSMEINSGETYKKHLPQKAKSNNPHCPKAVIIRWFYYHWSVFICRTCRYIAFRIRPQPICTHRPMTGAGVHACPTSINMAQLRIRWKRKRYNFGGKKSDWKANATRRVLSPQEKVFLLISNVRNFANKNEIHNFQ